MKDHLSWVSKVGGSVDQRTSLELANDQKQIKKQNKTEEDSIAKGPCWILTLIFAISSLYVTQDKQIILIYLVPKTKILD